MSRKCSICEKQRVLAWRIIKSRSKYNPTIKVKKYPNLQWVRVPADVKKKHYKDFAGKRVMVCTKCMKDIYKS